MIVTRFAPSPTGYLHAGNYRTAVFAYLYARKNNGKFILRIEDTDRARFDQKYQDNILESLSWLGLEYDELYIQSQRHARHTELMQKLVDEDKAYISHEEAKDGSGTVKQIVRFRNPGTIVTFHDIIRGDITVDTTDLGDFVIGRSITEPLFHFAVVVDDSDAGVTHVVRGDDHIANTPRQILIARALGATEFQFAHLPLVFGLDKQKLSKRRGAKALTEYRDEGYLADAVLNFMISMGWNIGEGGEQEIFSKKDLCKVFSLERVQKSPAIFNPEKLDWFNREYIKQLSETDQLDAVRPYVQSLSGFDENIFQKCLPLIIERVTKWSDVQTMVNTNDIQYYFTDPVVSNDLLTAKGTEIGECKKHLTAISELLQSYTGEWNTDSIKSLIMPYADEQGRGAVLWPLRCALSGREKSPDPFTLISVLGSESVFRRINSSIQ